MSSEAESMKSDDEDFSCGLLLRDIEEISKALYLDKSPCKAFNSSHDHRPHVAAAKTGISESNSKVITQDSLHKDKKSSIWNWKPLKALTHIRNNHRFNCCFFLHIHAIEGLPPDFNNLDLCVTWKRKDDMLRTRPSRVCSGMAEFEETLMHRCTVYGSRSGPHNSAKYEPKLFLLRASVIGAPTLDIGNHWTDLSMLLPLKLEELEGDKRSSGKWTTSFKLTGEAKGAILNVSFGFSIKGGNSFEPDYFMEVPDIVRDGHFADFESSSRTRKLRNLGDGPRISSEGLYNQSQSVDVKCSEEIFQNQELELSNSITLLCQKLDEVKRGNVMEFDLDHEHLESLKPKSDPSTEPIKFDVIEKCDSQRFENSVIETIDVAEIFKGEETDFDEYVEWNLKLDETIHHEQECATYDPENQTNNTCVIEPVFQELDSAGLDSLLDISKYCEQEICMKNEAQRLNKSIISLDDVEESIENDFLDMLNIDQSQYDMISGGSHTKLGFGDDFDLSFAIQAVERNPGSVNQLLRSERSAEILENLETEALMQEWGLNEEAFQYSPRVSSGGFGSPVYVPLEEPLKLPSIGEGIEHSIIPTKDGGFLRSMNRLLFRSANNGARLIVQVSTSVVLPPGMGFTIMDILQSWACGGVEKMCVWANKLMPLEDVTGKTMQQVLSEGESRSDAFKRWALQQESEVGLESDYVSIEDLIHMALTNIESLLVEGLKIESGMPNQEAPSSIMIQLAEDGTDENILKPFAADWRDFDKNFTMGLKVQLRDPLRNYEMVGSSMLALIQIDKKTCNQEKDGFDENIQAPEQKEKKMNESKFKVSRVHLAGVNGNKQLWGSSRQHQSGSRWLFSSGMSKSNKNLVSNSNAVLKSCSGLMRKTWPGDVLWSISSQVQDEASTWDEQVALNVHVRNPDIIFPN